MEEIDVAVFAFDAERRLRLVNRAGERLLDRPAERLAGRTRRGARAGRLPDGRSIARMLEAAFPGGSGPLGDPAAALPPGRCAPQPAGPVRPQPDLREEERQAWQRLIRVLGHEINNSLAPIKSIAREPARMLARNARPGRLPTPDLRGALP